MIFTRSVKFSIFLKWLREILKKGFTFENIGEAKPIVVTIDDNLPIAEDGSYCKLWSIPGESGSIQPGKWTLCIFTDSFLFYIG